MKIVCEECGKVFDKKPSQIKIINDKGQKHYCSKECQYKGMNKKIECICKECNSTIFKTPKEIDNSKSGFVFCNKSCSAKYNNSLRKKENNPNWKGGKFSYRKRSFEHYDEKCTICGFDKINALEIHHIDKNKDNSELDNLIVVCANCHRLIHSDEILITEELKNKRIKK